VGFPTLATKLRENVRFCDWRRFVYVLSSENKTAMLRVTRRTTEDGMCNFISVPDWADALFKVLDPLSTEAPITPKVEDGTIAPDASLLYKLGIGATRLENQVDKINGVIAQYRANDADGAMLDIFALAAVQTIGDLTNDVFGHLGSVGTT
jgi:hypothetical protein